MLWATFAMIISKDLFLLGDQDYLRLPNKDEKRAAMLRPAVKTQRYGESRPKTVFALSFKVFEFRVSLSTIDSKFNLNAKNPKSSARAIAGLWVCYGHLQFTADDVVSWNTSLQFGLEDLKMLEPIVR